MLTLAQARWVVVAAFGMRGPPVHRTRTVNYYLRRNHVAYQSHRRRKLLSLLHAYLRKRAARKAA